MQVSPVGDGSFLFMKMKYGFRYIKDMSSKFAEQEG